MLRFLVGFIAVALFATFAALLAGADGFGIVPTAGGAVRIAFAVMAAPLLAAWGTAEVIQRWRPRRHLVPPRRGTLLVVMAGAAASLVAVPLAGVGLALLGGRVAEALVTSGAAILAVSGALALLPRRRNGCCPHCSYDLRGGIDPGETRCPECGASTVLDTVTPAAPLPR